MTPPVAVEERQRQVRQRWKEMLDVDTVMEAPKLVDEDGFVHLDDMERDWIALQQLNEQAAALAVKVKAAEQAFQARIREAGADGAKINGVPRFTYRANGTFARKAFSDDNPILAKVYQIPTTTLDMEALRRDHPDVVRQYTPRRWLDVKPKKG